MAHRVCTFVIALALGLCFLPRAARADEPTPVITYDKGALPPPSARWAILGYGTLLAAGSYGIAYGASYGFSDDRGAEDLRLPVVGPWLKLGQTQLCNDTMGPTCNNVYQVMGAVLVGIDGLLQAGSIALLLQGVFMHTRRPMQAEASPAASFRGYRTETGPRWASPLVVHMGNVTMIPSFSSVAGADASFGYVGTF